MSNTKKDDWNGVWHQCLCWDPTSRFVGVSPGHACALLAPPHFSPFLCIGSMLPPSHYIFDTLVQTTHKKYNQCNTVFYRFLIYVISVLYHNRQPGQREAVFIFVRTAVGAGLTRPSTRENKCTADVYLLFNRKESQDFMCIY